MAVCVVFMCVSVCMCVCLCACVCVRDIAGTNDPQPHTTPLGPTYSYMYIYSTYSSKYGRVYIYMYTYVCVPQSVLESDGTV